MTSSTRHPTGSSASRESQCSSEVSRRPERSNSPATTISRRRRNSANIWRACAPSAMRMLISRRMGDHTEAPQIPTATITPAIARIASVNDVRVCDCCLWIGSVMLPPLTPVTTMNRGSQNFMIGMRLTKLARQRDPRKQRHDRVDRYFCKSRLGSQARRARATRVLFAPSAARIANSSGRDSARTSNRFATFAQAINSTTADGSHEYP